MKALLNMAVLLVVLTCVALSHSAQLNEPLHGELVEYEAQINVLANLLSTECSLHISVGKEDTLEKAKIHYEKLVRQLVECRNNNTRNSSTQKQVISPTTPQTTPGRSPSCRGNAELYIQLLSYKNPTNQRAAGLACDADGSPCDIAFEFCVSSFNSRGCELYHAVTDVVEEHSIIFFTNKIGNLTNPLGVNLGAARWERVDIRINVLDKDPGNRLRVYQDVDEFSYELTEVEEDHRLVNLLGKRATDKTQLAVVFTTTCPPPTMSPSTAPITTATYVPAECLTATNFTQSWRRDHNGTDIKGGGPHSSSGRACDLRDDLDWFRFTGKAGTHMLDKCPESLSCGAWFPLWTDYTYPPTVGTVANISVYRADSNFCNWRTRPIQVMRCSWDTDYDLIYKYVGKYYMPCNEAFCGMN